MDEKDIAMSFIDLGKKYDIHTFVECGDERSLFEATDCNHFKHILWFVSDQNSYIHIVNMFLNDSRVLPICGELWQVLPYLDGPALFHLKPLQAAKQLETVFDRRSTESNLIIIDDAHMFEEDYRYPTIAWMREIADNNGYCLFIHNDQIHLSNI